MLRWMTAVYVESFMRNITDAMAKSGKKIDRVFAVGPVPMMKAVADLTRKYEIPAIASLNPIMVDGTGMCGGCRVSVGGKTKFACVDGPEFDGHKVDFDGLMRRLGAYKHEEELSCECVAANNEDED